MRDRSFLIFAPLSVLASAIIAFGLVFWTPWFGARKDYGFSYSSPKAINFYPDTYTHFYPDTYDYQPLLQELAKLQPEQFQAIVKALFDDLVKLSEAELYMLSAAGDDVCNSPLIECQGVPGKNVRPFVEKALAHKQTRESVAIAASGLDTSRLSLVVSFAAFLVSLAGFAVAMFTYLRKRNA